MSGTDSSGTGHNSPDFRSRSASGGAFRTRIAGDRPEKPATCETDSGLRPLARMLLAEGPRLPEGGRHDSNKQEMF